MTRHINTYSDSYSPAQPRQSKRNLAVLSSLFMWVKALSHSGIAKEPDSLKLARCELAPLRMEPSSTIHCPGHDQGAAEGGRPATAT